MQLSVVLPSYNEGLNIERTVRDVFSWMGKSNIDGDVVVVNDGSRDDSAAVLSRLQSEFSSLNVLTNVEKTGYGAAITKGCDAATGEVIAFMDSDGQFKAHDLSTLWREIDTHAFVTGRRVKRADHFHRKVNAFFYGLLVRLTLGVTVPDLNCGMKMFRRDLWLHIRPRSATGALFNAEVYYRLQRRRVPVRSVPVPHYPRLLGAPDGAKPGVILKMFKELRALKMSVKSE